MKRLPQSWQLHFGVAIVATVLAVVARWLLDSQLNDRLPLVTLYAAVAVSAWVGGLGPAVLATIVGYLACNWLFMVPRGSLQFSRNDQLVGIFAYFVSCGVIILFGEARRVANERANQRAESLRVTLASIGDAVIVADLDAKITLLNEVAEALTGWKLPEAKGQPLEHVFRIINEVTRRPVENPAGRALREGKIVGLANHTVLIARDGTERAIDDSAAPIKDAAGHLSGVVLVFRDVSDQRKAAEELRRSEQELADFFENATIGLHWVGPDGIILRVNRAELDMLGYSEDEFVGHHIADFHADRAIIDDILRRLASGEPVSGAEAELRCKGGTLKPVVIDSSALFRDGVFIHTRCFTRDMTDRKRADDTSARLAAIVTSCEDAILSKDLNGIIKSWNKGAERLFGYTSEEMIGQPVSLIIPDERRHEEPKILSRIRRGERVEPFETVRRRKDGSNFDVSLSISPVIDDRGKILGASKIARDISARKKTEAELLEANRLKDEFLATLAHELRNPLAPLRNALEILKRTDDPKALETMRRIMDRQLGHLVRLTDDLLDINRINRGRIELRQQAVKLSDVVHQAVEACRPLVECAEHDIKIELPEMPIVLFGDFVRLTQIFANLINNACKYTNPRGKIVVAAQVDNRRVILTVRDNGVGIPSDRLTSIFAVFSQLESTLERSQGGLGLGLALAKRLTEMHGGQIEARSDGADRGSEFVVTLPLAEDSAASTGQNLNEVTENTFVKKRILIVDDNRDNAESISMLLSLTGHDTQTAHDGLEALATAEAFRPTAILLDIGLPKLNGYEVCQRIRKQPWAADTVMIALTGWGQEKDRQQSRDAGFHAHLVKPVALNDLLQLLETLQKSQAL